MRRLVVRSLDRRATVRVIPQADGCGRMAAGLVSRRDLELRRLAFLDAHAPGMNRSRKQGEVYLIKHI